MLPRMLSRKWIGTISVAVLIGISASACLPDIGPAPTADAYQRGMFDAVNRDRVNSGLLPLTFSPKLSVLAGGHSCDMQRAGHLFHSDLTATLDNPDYAAYWTLGENVAVGSSDMTPSALEDTWMASPTHQANIVNPNFNVVGMAACFAADGRVWATQEFGAL